MDPLIRFINAMMRSNDTYDYDRAQTPTLGNFSPEMALMAAVLEDALAVIDGKVTAGTYFAAKESKELLRRQTIKWMWMNDTEWPFSFVNICEHFHLDPQAVRKRIAARVK
jgi:hypothetical protein